MPGDNQTPSLTLGFNLVSWSNRRHRRVSCEETSATYFDVWGKHLATMPHRSNGKPQAPTLDLKTLLAQDYVNESCVLLLCRMCNLLNTWTLCSYRHMEAFSHALQLDESYFDHQGDAASPQIPGTPVSSSSRIRKVSALSDFAPVNLKVKRYIKIYVHPRIIGHSYQFVASIDERNEVGRTKEAITFFCFFAGHFWCVSFFLLVTVAQYWLKLNQVFHFPVHCGGIWVLRCYQTTGQYQRMDISLYVTYLYRAIILSLYLTARIIRAGSKGPVKKKYAERQKLWSECVQQSMLL